MKFILSIILTTLCIADSRSQTCLSYEDRLYVGQDGVSKEFTSSNRFMSCGEWLVEFDMRVSMVGSTHNGVSVSQKVYIDTVACYFLDIRNKVYYQVDTFLLQHKIIAKGSFSQKPTGISIRDSFQTLDPDFSANSVRDSVVDGINVKLADINVPLTTEGHEQKMIIMFRDDISFHSPFTFSPLLDARKS